MHDAFRNPHAPHLGGIGSQQLTIGNPHYKLRGAAAQVNDAKRALFLAEVRHRANETQFCFFLPGNHLGTRTWADLAQQFRGHGEKLVLIAGITGGGGSNHAHILHSLLLHEIYVFGEHLPGALQCLGGEFASGIHPLAQPHNLHEPNDLPGTTMIVFGDQQSE